MKVRKSILGVVLGVGLALALGLGASEIQARAAAARSDSCDKSDVCPVSKCPMQKASTSI